MTLAAPGSDVEAPGPATGLRRGALAVLGSEVAIRSTGLVSVLVVSRVLGPSVLGFVAVAVALLSYGSVFSDAGLSTLAQRRIVAEPSSAGRVTSAVMTVQLLVAAGASLFLLGVMPVLGLSGETAWLVVAGLPVLLMQALSTDYVLQVYARMGWFAAARTLAQVFGSTVGLALVIVTRDPVWLVLAAWWGTGLSAALCLFVLRRQGFRLADVTSTEIRLVCRHGRAYLGNAVAIQILTNLDVVVVGVLADPRHVGEYAAAYRVAYTLLVAAGVLVSAVFPRMIATWEADRTQFRILLRRLVVLAARVTFPLTALVCVDAGAILRLVFGGPFAAASPVLAVMFVWVPFGWLNTLSGQALMAAGRTAIHLKRVILSAAVLAVLLVLLVPRFGIVGAASSVAATEILTTLTFGVAAARHLGLRTAGVWLSQLAWLVGPAAALVLARLLLPVPSALLVGAGGAAVVLAALEWATPASTVRMLVGTGRRVTA